MAIPGIFQSFLPEAYLPRFVYFPLYFKGVPQVLTGADVEFEQDVTGRFSIIRLVDKENTRITPFIDLTKYDQETKDWYIYYSEDRLPYRFDGVNVYNMYPSELGSLTNIKVISTSFNNITGEVELLLDYQSNTYKFYKYAPVSLILDNIPSVDLTDYTNITSTESKLSIFSSVNEVSYDFEERLYTNKNLSEYRPENIKIIIYRIIENSVSLKCVLNSNSGSDVTKTPIIDDYIIKLKGQYLRG